MPGERTPLFGITDATRKPLNRAASELTQAINALDRHDSDERAAIPRAAGDMARATKIRGLSVIAGPPTPPA